MRPTQGAHEWQASVGIALRRGRMWGYDKEVRCGGSKIYSICLLKEQESNPRMVVSAHYDQWGRPRFPKSHDSSTLQIAVILKRDAIFYDCNFSA